MARTRMLKPEFFQNKQLADLGPLTMLHFAGLWTLADREGRLKDNPVVIHAQLFPFYQNIDIDSALESLGTSGFIQRYKPLTPLVQVTSTMPDGYIQIINFTKHQKVHPNEAKSLIPSAAECHKSLTPMVEVASTNGTSHSGTSTFTSTCNSESRSSLYKDDKKVGQF